MVREGDNGLQDNNVIMGKFDRKTQMMDAGTVLFRSEGDFGSAIGKVKRTMLPYGRVWTSSELDMDALPSSGRGCDLLLDWSTPWRTRYISCKVSSSGEAWAAVFKEGNRSGILRSVTFIALIVILLSLAIFGHAGFFGGLLSVALCLILLYLWLVPSRKAVTTVRGIMKSFK